MDEVNMYVTLVNYLVVLFLKAIFQAPFFSLAENNLYQFSLSCNNLTETIFFNDDCINELNHKQYLVENNII